MITDALKNHVAYAGLHPRFTRAFGYLLNADFSRLPDGRTEIDGSEIYLIMSRGELKKPAAAPLEVHDRYIDIQLAIEGTETFGWRERSELKSPRGGFDAGRDIQFFDDAPTSFHTIHGGQMTIFFPTDGHAPMIGEGRITKCVVKVLL